MKILKFGGSSVGSSEKIKNVIDIITSTTKKKVKTAVVFSAFQGITDELIRISKLASTGNNKYQEFFNNLEQRHLSIAKDLIAVKKQSNILANIKLNLNELEEVIHGVFLVKELSPRTLDFILSFGERLSAYIIANALHDRGIPTEYLDSRELVKTDNSFGNAKVDFEQTTKQIKDYFRSHKRLQIITGFIGSTVNNETTTLGRGGSDYTAAIFGAALNASEIQIWTDVDGVMTADPRKVKNAFSLPHITYEEAMELSHFGAKVIHPPTIQPAFSRKIPIVIKNTFNPEFAGTLITNKPNSNKFTIKGLSSIDNIALIRIQGSGMIGVSGIAKRIFSALAGVKINVILITQASSEHSLCIAVLPQNAILAKKSIEKEFKFEIFENLVNEPIIEENVSIVAVVGENMRNYPGISGKVFQALGRNGINVVAIAQGSSELNISTVISREHESKALNALHDSLFLSKEKSVNIFLIGTGLIGGTLLNQIDTQINYLLNEFGLDFKVIGLANSRKMLIEHNGIDVKRWKDKLDTKGISTDLEKFIDNMRTLNLSNSVFIDCTASKIVVEKYPDILSSNISIVTPNKIANSVSYGFYQKLKQLALKHNVKFLYETNVGAGLPIIGTLKDLVSSGDEIQKIEGILSGTLSYIFNTFSKDKPFSEVVKLAKDKGYTEPDPREDLSGMDVARKLLILAREAGLMLELKDIKIEKILPVEVDKAKSVNDFFIKLKKYDKDFEHKREKAAAKGNLFRYIASLENSKAKISMQEVNTDHPFYFLSGIDNVIAFTTKYNQERPVVVKGPGAGAEVTASGVFADIIRAARYLS
ncbi:MAG: bifunctional aspartate kinase/homoserine dehydrogenase I [Ignavibacteriaceae bacterium]